MFISNDLKSKYKMFDINAFKYSGGPSAFCTAGTSEVDFLLKYNTL